jgi:DNA repair protein RadC
MHVYEAKLVYSLISLGDDVRLDKPAKVADYLRSAFDENPMQEAFYCVHLDRKNHPLGRQLITLGTATSTLVSPKEVFRGAILSGATAIVVAHNHPSGDPSPSHADVTATRALIFLIQAGRLSVRCYSSENYDVWLNGRPKM